MSKGWIAVWLLRGKEDNEKERVQREEEEKEVLFPKFERISSREEVPIHRFVRDLT